MTRTRRNEAVVALVLVAPFVAIYAWLFIYPTIQMVILSFTDSPLIGEGTWNGIDNYMRLFSDRVFKTAVFNTGYFVVLTVVPGTMTALAIALMVSRLNGYLQSIVLAAFFLPFILPVTVVYLIWWWIFDPQFGLAQYIIRADRRRAHCRLAPRQLVHADGRACDGVVDEWLQHPAVPGGATQHSARAV